MANKLTSALCPFEFGSKGGIQSLTVNHAAYLAFFSVKLCQCCASFSSLIILLSSYQPFSLLQMCDSDCSQIAHGHTSCRFMDMPLFSSFQPSSEEMCKVQDPRGDSIKRRREMAKVQIAKCKTALDTVRLKLRQKSSNMSKPYYCLVSYLIHA